MDRECDQLIQKQKHRDTETKYPGPNARSFSQKSILNEVGNEG